MAMMAVVMVAMAVAMAVMVAEWMGRTKAEVMSAADLARARECSSGGGGQDSTTRQHTHPHQGTHVAKHVVMKPVATLARTLVIMSPARVGPRKVYTPTRSTSLVGHKVSVMHVAVKKWHVRHGLATTCLAQCLW